MNYGGFDVFKTYLAVKNHFNGTYDFSKYGGRVTASLESFTKRPDRYFFHKLSKRYNEREILDYFVSNFALDGDKWIGNLLNNEGSENYTKWRKYRESSLYLFESDCKCILNDFDNRGISFDDGFHVHNGQHPRVLRLLIQKKIHIQTAIIIDSILSFSKVWNKKISEKVIWPEIYTRMKKLEAFVQFNQTECKFIMGRVFVNGK